VLFWGESHDGLRNAGWWSLGGSLKGHFDLLSSLFYYLFISKKRSQLMDGRNRT
jgi:hypothetical protein